MAANTAHITFSGGGMVISAATPYERQVLIEHVLGHVRSKRHIQVQADRRRWVVELADEGKPTVCAHCERRIFDAVCRSHLAETPYCVVCALER
jgi:hypothetical protein